MLNWSRKRQQHMMEGKMMLRPRQELMWVRRSKVEVEVHQLAEGVALKLTMMWLNLSYQLRSVNWMSLIKRLMLFTSYDLYIHSLFSSSRTLVLGSIPLWGKVKQGKKWLKTISHFVEESHYLDMNRSWEMHFIDDSSAF